MWTLIIVLTLFDASREALPPYSETTRAQYEAWYEAHTFDHRVGSFVDASDCERAARQWIENRYEAGDIPGFSDPAWDVQTAMCVHSPAA